PSRPPVAAACTRGALAATLIGTRSVRLAIWKRSATLPRLIVRGRGPMGRVVWAAAAAAIVALLGTVSVAPAAPKHPKGEAVPGELIVGFAPGTTDQEQEKALKKAGVKAKKGWAKIHAKLAG